MKIDPRYHGAVVHVHDASRAVGVVGALLSSNSRAAYADDVQVQGAGGVRGGAFAAAGGLDVHEVGEKIGWDWGFASAGVGGRLFTSSSPV